MAEDNDGYHTFAVSFGRHSLDKPRLNAIAEQVIKKLATYEEGAVTAGEIIRDIDPDLSPAEVNYVYELVV